MSLIRLPNGNVVAPGAITAIEAHENAQPYVDKAGATFLARVVVETVKGPPQRFSCATFADAERLRDDLIAQVSVADRKSA